MKNTLNVGDQFTHVYRVPREKTVPYLYPESALFRGMPEVFATGFMVGLLEWCCIEALSPHLEEGEISLGTYIRTSHCAPTPAGVQVTVLATCTAIKNGNNIFWEVVARDEVEEISRGEHGRHIVDQAKFLQKVARKAGDRQGD